MSETTVVPFSKAKCSPFEKIAAGLQEAIAMAKGESFIATTNRLMGWGEVTQAGVALNEKQIDTVDRLVLTLMRIASEDYSAAEMTAMARKVLANG